jgi:hypothetical protein
MTKTHYESPIGLEVYQFDDSDTICISGNVPQKYTVVEFDSAYDFEEYVRDYVDSDGIEYDSEYSQFFAYAKTPERAIKYVNDIENWFANIRSITSVKAKQ